jgi:hypothetical protein
MLVPLCNKAVSEQPVYAAENPCRLEAIQQGTVE